MNKSHHPFHVKFVLSQNSTSVQLNSNIRHILLMTLLGGEREREREKKTKTKNSTKPVMDNSLWYL